MEDYSRDNRELQRLMELQRQKLEATTKEMKKEQQQVHDLKVEIGNFKAGLHSTSQHIQEPKRLKEAVKALYRKYLRDHELVCSCTCVYVIIYVINHMAMINYIKQYHKHSCFYDVL